MSRQLWALLALAVSVGAVIGGSVSKLPAQVQPASAPSAVSLPERFEIRLPNRSFTPTPEVPDWMALFTAATGDRVHAIVQLTDLPDAGVRTGLASAGVVLGQPLSGQAYFATVGRTVNPASPVLRTIRWVGRLSPADKIAPELQRPQSSRWARRNVDRIELVIKLFGDGDLLAVADRVRELGGQLMGEAAGAYTLTATMPLGREGDLAALDDVRFIEPLIPPGQGESNLARAHVDATVGVIPVGEPNGTGVIVGIFDDEHVRAHPDFGARQAQGDLGTSMPGPHPTMTAGMIAGDGSGSLGNSAPAANAWRGLAPAAQIRSFSFANSGGDTATDYMNDLIRASTTGGIVVANNSWGTTGCADFAFGSYTGRTPFIDGVVRGAAGRPPVTVVFSAGNERSRMSAPSCIANTTPPFANYTTVNHPKSAKNALVVGAVDSANNAMTTYSSWGPTLDGRLKPDVVASGHHRGTMISGASLLDNPFGMPFGALNQQSYRVPLGDPSYVYGWFNQTSSAAAVASGTVALMIDAWRRAFPAQGNPLPSTLRALLVHNARDLDDVTTWFNPGPDYASGYGLIRVTDTLKSLSRGEARQGVVDQGGSVRFTVAIPAGATFKATLSWDDAPAVEGANPALVNDLDLVVTDPAGVRHYPWTLNRANPSASASRTGEDRINNLEQVAVETGVVGGDWTVDVRGTEVPAGPQSFSLVMPQGVGPRPPTNLRIVQ
jgi:hypothetical protein